MGDRGRGASRRSLLTRQSWRGRAPRTSSYSSALCPNAWPYCTYSLHLLGPQRKRSLVMGMGNHPSVSPNAPGHGLRTFSNGTPPPTIVPTVGDLVSHGRINMRLRALCAGNKHGTEDINIPRSYVCQSSPFPAGLLPRSRRAASGNSPCWRRRECMLQSMGAGTIPVSGDALSHSQVPPVPVPSRRSWVRVALPGCRYLPGARHLPDRATGVGEAQAG